MCRRAWTWFPDVAALNALLNACHIPEPDSLAQEQSRACLCYLQVADWALRELHGSGACKLFSSHKPHGPNTLSSTKPSLIHVC